MNRRSRYLAKNVGILTVSNFGSKLLVFLLVPLYTSVLNTHEAGTYDLVVSTCSLLLPVLTLNIVDAVMRFTMDETRAKNEVASIGLKYVLISILIFFVGVLICKVFNIFPPINNYYCFVFLFFACSALNQYLIQLAKGLEKVNCMAIAGIINTVAMLGLNIIFLLGLKWGLRGFFIANSFAPLLSGMYLGGKIRIWEYVTRIIRDENLEKEMLLYCVPLIATAVGWWVNSASDKYVVSFICGVAANGILSVSYKIPAIINTLQSIFIQAWQISAVKEYGEEGTAEFYGRTFFVLNVFMASACSWLILLAKPIGHVLYQKEFYIAWHYVPFLLIASVLNSASGFLGPILSAKKASKPMAMSAIYGASANVVLNIIFVYMVGIQGATIATVISSYIIYSVRKKAVGAEIQTDGYYIVLITWILLCVQAAMEIYAGFWALEIILMLVMAFLNRNGLANIFKMIKGIIRK